MAAGALLVYLVLMSPFLRSPYQFTILLHLVIGSARLVLTLIASAASLPLLILLQMEIKVVLILAGLFSTLLSRLSKLFPVIDQQGLCGWSTRRHCISRATAPGLAP
ncbi:hypothetical protein CYR75_02590 [Paracoccus jeotgali]|uniref:Uncharacterized protein n=2 Tax=Paracoccus jeotgali TaxID=2065379 RepID=A0A2K9MCF3_9RHOB|nr:hypothetical protein CYR75_02590 [Paracoccus jeotgali]